MKRWTTQASRSRRRCPTPATAASTCAATARARSTCGAGRSARAKCTAIAPIAASRRGPRGRDAAKNADKPIGQWNRFIITMNGDRLTVVLNGETVIENAQLPGVPRAARSPCSTTATRSSSRISSSRNWIDQGLARGDSDMIVKEQVRLPGDPALRQGLAGSRRELRFRTRHQRHSQGRGRHRIDQGSREEPRQELPARVVQDQRDRTSDRRNPGDHARRRSRRAAQ